MLIILLCCVISYYIIKNKLYNFVSKEDLLVYGVLLLLLFKLAIRTEMSDIKCPEGPHTKDKSLCKEGNGKLFQVAKYNKNDDINKIGSKITKLIQNKHTQVYWRRSFILSIIIAIMGNYIILGSLPRARNLLFLFLLVYVCSTSMNSFYVHHYDKIFDKKIVEGVNKIRSLEKKKICKLLAD
jgi:hypothetical protein